MKRPETSPRAGCCRAAVGRPRRPQRVGPGRRDGAGRRAGGRLPRRRRRRLGRPPRGCPRGVRPGWAGGARARRVRPAELPAGGRDDARGRRDDRVGARCVPAPGIPLGSAGSVGPRAGLRVRQRRAGVRARAAGGLRRRGRGRPAGRGCRPCSVCGIATLAATCADPGSAARAPTRPASRPRSPRRPSAPDPPLDAESACGVLHRLSCGPWWMSVRRCTVLLFEHVFEHPSPGRATSTPVRAGPGPPGSTERT